MLAERPTTAARSLPAAALALAQLLPGLTALAVFLAWARLSGGYFPHVWYAGGLVLLGAFVSVVVAWPSLLAGLDRATSLALLALAGFTAWSYLSILWADVPGDAWDGANRTALYLVVFALFALWSLSAASVLALLGVFSLGVCLLGVAAVAGAARADDAESWFIGGRFTDPIGYVNGTAALFVLAFWPAFLLASRREVPLPLRPVFLAAAGVLLELALLPQSRGAGVAFGVVLLVYLVLVPGRVRTLLFLAPVALAVAAGFPRLLDVGADTDGAALAAGARSAAGVMAVTAAALAAAGLVGSALDRRVAVPRRLHLWTGRALLAVAAVGALAAAAVALATVDVGARAEEAWRDFTTDEPPAGDSSYLLSGLHTNRADLWRVAWEEFREHPLQGIGAENFAVPYVRERNSDEETLYPHSFPLQVLVQTGLVGALLMLLFLAGALAAGVRALRHGSELARATSAVAIVVFASWLVHGSIDWFWELPALAAPAVAALALAGSTGRPTARRSSRRAPLLAAAAVALAVAAALSFVFPWLAVRESRLAIAVWRTDPARAQEALDRARRLNPLAERADLVAGSIARRQRDWNAMADAYARALERNPHNWYSHLQLAMARARQGRRGEARAAIAAAGRLNPGEPVVRLVSGWLARGERVRVDQVSAILLERHARETS